MALISSRADQDDDCPRGTKRKSPDGHQQLLYHRPQNDNHRWSRQPGLLADLSLTSCRELTDQCLNSVLSLDGETRSHLESSYWTHCHSFLPLLIADHLVPQKDAYSPILHLAALAAGWRYAAPGRYRPAAVATDSRESCLHRTLRDSFDRQGAVTGDAQALQALVLLAELEYGCGRYLSASTYLDKASQYNADNTRAMGHHSFVCSDEEILLRTRSSRASTALRMQWDFFHQPRLHAPQARSILDSPSTSGYKSILRWESDDTVVAYHALLDVMQIGHTIRAVTLDGSPNRGKASFVQLRRLETQLVQFHRDLPEKLSWKSQSWRTATPATFAFHQQLSLAYMCLYKGLGQFADEAGLDESFVMPAGSTVVTHDQHIREFIRFGCILSQYHKRFGHFKVCNLVVQQIGIALDILDTRRSHLMCHKEDFRRSLKACVMALEAMTDQHKLAESLGDLARAAMMSFDEPAEGPSPPESRHDAPILPLVSIPRRSRSFTHNDTTELCETANRMPGFPVTAERGKSRRLGRPRISRAASDDVLHAVFGPYAPEASNMPELDPECSGVTSSAGDEYGLLKHLLEPVNPPRDLNERDKEDSTLQEQQIPAMDMGEPTLPPTELAAATTPTIARNLVTNSAPNDLEHSFNHDNLWQVGLEDFAPWLDPTDFSTTPGALTMH